MMRFRWIFIILIVVLSVGANGQYTKEFKRIFFDAEYLYQTGFYEEAFNRYKNLLTLDPGNSNILFHCGACCLNIPGSEDQAIIYLQEAVSGVTPDYKERSHKESRAPVITYFMLGKAYHLHNEFNRAIINYGLYLEMGSDKDPLQVEYARVQIEACKRASTMVGKPPSYDFQSVLDQFDDDLPSCNNPVISGNGNILIFLVDYPSDKKIMMTKRTGNVWSRPRVINSEIGMVGETYPVCMSYDGNDLYIVHQFYSHSDIFVSSFEGGRWSQAEALGTNINGRTSELHASISKDGSTLYFTSDRRGGFGSFDIFVSRRQPDGDWGSATNLGPVINTPFEEHTPFISSNDSILFFSSQGHSSIGGLDNFYSELDGDGSWGEPVNLGYPVNTTGDNQFFNPGWDELDGYYAVRREDDPTSNAINMVIELEPPEQVVAEQTVTGSEPEGQDQNVFESEPEGREQPTSMTKPADRQQYPEPLPGNTGTSIPENKVSAERAPAGTAITGVLEPRETDRIEEVLNREYSEDEKAPEGTNRTEGPSVIYTSIPFDHNSYELNMAATVEVEKIADLMLQNPDLTSKLTGHADATGSADYNMLLSMQRADYIAQYLVARGVKEERITVQGMGEDAPVALNSYPDGKDAPLGRYLNRHVYVTISGLLPSDAGLPAPYVPVKLRPSNEKSSLNKTPVSFTIQVMAGLAPADDSVFKNLGYVKEFVCRDGYYRYAFGTFDSFSEAKKQLAEVRRKGYYGAFIQTVDWYSEATR